MQILGASTRGKFVGLPPLVHTWLSWIFFSFRPSGVYLSRIVSTDLVGTQRPFAADQGRLLEELLDQVDVGHDHAAAAVTLEAELVHRIAIAHVRIRYKMEVGRLTNPSGVPSSMSFR